MLSFLTGGKVDHPMAEPKRAREIISELPTDPLKALAEITQLLDSLRETPAYKVDRLFENIDLLDSAAKNHQRKLSQDYFATNRQQKFQEARLWTGAATFWKALSNAYLECVNRFESGQTGGLAFRKNLPIIVARTLRTLTLQLKWVLVRYGPVEPRVWSDIGRLYQVAEATGFADTVVEIYPGAHGGGTVKQEFLKAMMLGISSTDGLSPMRQELAERAVANFAAGFRLAAQSGPGCSYCFDIAAGRPPYRVVGTPPTAQTARFFGAGDALAQLRKVESVITETGAIPAQVHLGGSYPKEVVLPVLRHLALYWSDAPPARGAERRHTASRMTVLHGLAEILRALDPGSSDDLDFSGPESSAESWIVENVSDGGCGAIIPAAKSDWVRVGALIGVKSESAQRWGIGLIRRVTRDEHQQRRVGVQLLSKIAIPIRLAKAGAAAGAPADTAILLSTSPDSRGEVGVVLREGVYNGRDSLDMTVNNKPYLLMPARLVEGGEDFDWAMFKVMARSS